MNYQIEFRHLHYFRVLAEELHFRKAAERLFISQPGLTRQIKQMEEIYRTPLFERDKRNVKLTEAGIFLKQEVDLVFNQLNNIRTQIEKIAEGKITNLKLGFIGSAVQTILPELLAKLKVKQPLIDISLQELSNEIQLEMLVRNELDFGFVRTANYPSQIQTYPILTENFALVVPKGHPITTRKKVSLSDFKEESFILFSKQYSASYYDLVMSIFRDHQFEPKVALRTVNALSIFNLVSQGIGIAIVPSSLKKGYHADVEFIELTHIPQRTTLYLAWNKENRNHGIPFFTDILKEILQ
ncbi:DNA-binding transcriptional LysR family regulator [Sphingobacterium alimentarium]|uniref:DNA-binding transcriptional LysR family regulator n=1 Tax=Sphingobacterium alimentarium TaxID=797292 RepID=A0A4R3VYK4_9SPHI|nr:LysR family transcriptional regulator [Sphingobacterium alimentarium]TCV15287.1 DNA-binding transcriptional LysR family regulator [Sphingobacterium alimentarium]